MRYRLGFAASWRAAMPTAPGSEVSPGVSNRMVSVMDPRTLTPDPAPGNGFSLEAIIVVSGFMGKHIAWYACLPKLFSQYGERQTYRRAPDRLTRLSGVDMPDPRFPQRRFTMARSSAQSAQHPCETHPSRLRAWSISCGHIRLSMNGTKPRQDQNALANYQLVSAGCAARPAKAAAKPARIETCKETLKMPVCRTAAAKAP